jgi:hypothetical protein
MALAKVGRMSFKMPGRGRVKFGVYEGTLTGYTNGTGILMDKTVFNVDNLLLVVIVFNNNAGANIADWNRSTGYAKVYAAGGAEVATNALDAISATVFYLGF